jgi:hypothetical protein
MSTVAEMELKRENLYQQLQEICYSLIADG